MDTTNEMQSVIETARISTEPRALDLGLYHIVSTPSGLVEVDLTGDQWRRRLGMPPVAKTGTVTVTDVSSFVAYFDKHSSPYAEIFADRDQATVTAVLDAHGPYDAGPEWQQHRLVLKLRHTEAYKAWAGISGKLMPQTAFAEFIEDHRGDIREPAAADVLEMAQTIQGTKNASFKSSMLLRNGQRQLSYVERIDANAGQRGELAVPDSLTLGLAVYEGATHADPVTARLRIRIDGEGRLGLGVILDQLADVVAAAFEGVITAIAESDKVGVPILRGTPA